MATLTAEVIGNYDTEGDANALVYAPLSEPCRYRRTRVYELDYDGPEDQAEAFVRRVLVDQFAEQVHFGGAPALSGYCFHVDYGMKPGALDLEKEAILESQKGARNPGITLTALKLTQRIYIFSEAKPAAATFVRDVCNPAIHVWSVTDSDGRDVA